MCVDCVCGACDTASQRVTGQDGYVAGPLRTNFGAQLNTDLFGFFPGVGRGISKTASGATSTPTGAAATSK